MLGEKEYACCYYFPVFFFASACLRYESGKKEGKYNLLYVAFSLLVIEDMSRVQRRMGKGTMTWFIHFIAFFFGYAWQSYKEGEKKGNTNDFVYFLILSLVVFEN